MAKESILTSSSFNVSAPKIPVDGPMYSFRYLHDVGYRIEAGGKSVQELPSPYEIVLPAQYSNAMDNYHDIEPDDYRLAEFLFEKIFFNPDYGFDIEECLGYHFDKFTGSKKRFINFTKVALTKKVYSDANSNILSESIAKTVLSWCDVKLIQLSAAPDLEATGKKTVDYCLDLNTIDALHRLFNGVVFEEMTLPSFITCFDKNNVPDLFPTFKSGKQNLFVFALSRIPDVGAKLALSNFRIKNFHKLKGTPLPKAKRDTERKIVDILNAGKTAVKIAVY